MNIQHFEKGVTYTDREFNLMARKLGKLATLCRRVKDESSSIRFEAIRRDTRKKGDEVKVMITVSLPKKILRAESRRGTLMEAVDRCMEKVIPQVEKYKELHSGRGRKKVDVE